MTVAPVVEARSSGARSAQRWIFSRNGDAAAFVAPTVLAFALLAVGHGTGLSSRPVPLWLWFAAILVVDVAHVWTTVFRVYLDPDEVRRRRALYVTVPILAYAVGVALHAVRPRAFWMTLAYLAVFHFVRQQYGWVAIYKRRNRDTAAVDNVLDTAAIYNATLFPLLWWHAHLPRSFEWLIQGDFAHGVPDALVRALHPVHFAVMGVWAARQIQRFALERTYNVGKIYVIVTTWACWYVGIVRTDGDFAFTVTNVFIHGVPYTALLWRYARRKYAPSARERSPFAAATMGEWIVARGAAVYLLVVVALAWCEEGLWDQLVWHERQRVFGDAGLRVGGWVLAVVVPLLAVPQATHYLLDGWIWRMGPRNPTLARDLGLDAVTDRSD